MFDICNKVLFSENKILWHIWITNTTSKAIRSYFQRIRSYDIYGSQAQHMFHKCNKIWFLNNKILWHIWMTNTTYVSHMFYICFTYVSQMFHICFTYVSHVFHICFTYVPHMFYICVTDVWYMFLYAFFLCIVLMYIWLGTSGPATE